MTIIGFIFLLLIIFCWIKSYESLVILTLVSCVFVGTSMVDIGDKSIPPYLFCATSVVLYNFFHWGANFIGSKLSMVVLLFLIYVIFITAVSPMFFSGMRVLPSNLDLGVEQGGIPLKFGLNNIAQLLYVVVNMLTVCCLFRSRHLISGNIVKKSFLISLSLVLFLGFWDYVSKITEAIRFPYEILLNSLKMNVEEGSQYTSTISGFYRYSSLFTEASYCGAFLAAAFWTLFALEKKTIFVKILLVLTLVANILSLSGTAIVTLIMGFAVFILANKKRLSYLLILLVFLIPVFVILSKSQLGYALQDLLLNKLDSQSGYTRMASIKYSYNAFVESYGLGVGLGSTRSTSFIADLFATIGVLGVSLLVAILVPLYKGNNRNYMFVYSMVLLLSQVIAIPDLSFGCFWFGVFSMALLVNKKELYVGR